MPEKVMPQTVMAMALLKAHARKEPQSVEGISGLFADNPSIEELTKDSVIVLRRVPGGLYSEDVDCFISRLRAFGFADGPGGPTSPISLEVDGLCTCFRILCEEERNNPSGVKALAAVLDFKISDLLFCLRYVEPLLP